MSTRITAREYAAELLRRAAVARRMQYCDRHSSLELRTHRLRRARQLLAEARRLRGRFAPLP